MNAVITVAEDRRSVGDADAVRGLGVGYAIWVAQRYIQFVALVDQTTNGLAVAVLVAHQLPRLTAEMVRFWSAWFQLLGAMLVMLVTLITAVT